MTDPLTVAGFDALAADTASELIRPVCASPQWARVLIAQRPHTSLDALAAASSAAIGTLPWSEIEIALAAHPRIGDRSSGVDVESAWSRQEQSAAGDASAARALYDGNVAYERRFGHVFLICATGRSAPDILAALTARLDNDEATERAVVRAELAAIAALRLAKLFEGRDS